MSETTPIAASTPFDSTFEEKKWEVENSFREREIRVKEREQECAEKELEFKQSEQFLSKWTNPLVVAILAAAIAAGGNAWVAYWNGSSARQLETLKGEQTRILEMIKTGNPDKAAENLKFLLDAGLIQDTSTSKQVTLFLKNRRPGSGPSLPVASRNIVEERVAVGEYPEVHIEGGVPKIVMKKMYQSIPQVTSDAAAAGDNSQETTPGQK